MAEILIPRIRMYSSTDGTDDFENLIRATGSFSLQDLYDAELIEEGDLFDYAAGYGDEFETGTGKVGVSGGVVKVMRGCLNDSDVWNGDNVDYARHAGGIIDDDKIAFLTGAKTIIVDFAIRRLGTGVLRTDVVQNLSSARRSRAQENLGRLPAEVDTEIVLRQNFSPIGWNLVTTHNDKALRVVSGTPGSGGSVAFSTAFARVETDNFTLTNSHMAVTYVVGNVYDPWHAHSASTSATRTGGNWVQPGAPGGTNASNDPSSVTVNAAPTGITMDGYVAGGGAAHKHGIDLRVQYADVRFFKKAA